jgi:hypothetical protein
MELRQSSRDANEDTPHRLLFGKSVLGCRRRVLTWRRAKIRFRKVSSIGDSYTRAALFARDFDLLLSFLSSSIRTVEAKRPDADFCASGLGMGLR